MWTSLAVHDGGDLDAGHELDAGRAQAAATGAHAAVVS